MRNALRILAIILFLAALFWWSFSGFNKGWTKTSVQIWNFDEVAEISYPTSVERFVPGIDFVVGGTILSLLLIGLSFIFRKRQPLNQPPN